MIIIIVCAHTHTHTHTLSQSTSVIKYQKVEDTGSHIRMHEHLLEAVQMSEILVNSSSQRYEERKCEIISNIEFGFILIVDFIFVGRCVIKTINFQRMDGQTWKSFRKLSSICFGKPPVYFQFRPCDNGISALDFLSIPICRVWLCEILFMTSSE